MRLSLQPLQQQKQQQQLQMMMTTELGQNITLLQLTNRELANYLEQLSEENPFLDVTWPSTIGGSEEEQTERWIAQQHPRDDLKEQLSWMTNDERLKRIGHALIDSLDSNGYFREEIEEWAELFDVPSDKAERALAFVRQLEPVGIGARSLIDCLCMQADTFAPHEPIVRRCIEDDLRAIASQEIDRLATKYDVSRQKMDDIVRLLQSFDPKPLREQHPVDYVTADFIATDVDGKWEVTFDRLTVPSLQLHFEYAHLTTLDDPFVQQKMKEYEFLKTGLEERQQTMERFAIAIAELQQSFFEKGKEALRPLTMKEVATRIERHESTVSRTVANKWIETQHGTYPLKSLFPARVTDQEVTPEHVQRKIETLIRSESPSRPLSDQAIADALENEGLTIARRTVAKYRIALGYESSTRRKVR